MCDDDDLAQQRDELLALDSIFANDKDTFGYEIRDDAKCSATASGFIAIPVKCEEEPVVVRLALKSGASHHTIRELPCVMLDFRFPSDYPSGSAPHVELRASWLTNDLVRKLHVALKNDFELYKGGPVLFACIQTVQDVLQENVPSEIDLDEWVKDLVNWEEEVDNDDDMVVTHRRPMMTTAKTEQTVEHDSNMSYNAVQLYRMLCDFDVDSDRRAFARASHDCDVCLRTLPGVDCVRFLSHCNHVFCRDCVRQYFRAVISDGAGLQVYRLGCLSPDCDTLADPALVRDVLVGDHDEQAGDMQLYERYESLMLASSLDLMSDVVRCPRPTCQLPVLLEFEVDPDTGAAVIENNRQAATCAVCSFSFCTYCRKGYHGVSPCAFTNADKKKIVAEYLGGSADLRRAMERRFGRMTLRRLADEHEAHEWIAGNSKPCPHCRVNIEKNSGCNKMHCARCGTSFCWLCLTRLNPLNPYAHFNTTKSSCHQRLFDGLTQDEIERLDDFL